MGSVRGKRFIADTKRRAAARRRRAGALLGVGSARALGDYRDPAGAAPPSGREPSLELALTGAIVPELQREILRSTIAGGSMSEDEIVALLAIARETQRARIAGHTGDDVRYEALMVANALAIAERWIRAHVHAERNERDGLAALYAETPGSVRELRKLLARGIRGGVTAERLDQHPRARRANRRRRGRGRQPEHSPRSEPG